MSAPTLLTKRLELRAPRPEDYAAFAETWADKDVVKFIGGEPRGAQDSWLTLMRNAGAWHLLGFGPWIVCERETGRLSGMPDFAIIGAVCRLTFLAGRKPDGCLQKSIGAKDTRQRRSLPPMLGWMNIARGALFV